MGGNLADIAELSVHTSSTQTGSAGASPSRPLPSSAGQGNWLTLATVELRPLDSQGLISFESL